MKKILYVSGSRADFGLLKTTLLKLHHANNVKLKIGVTGSHLQQSLGNTIEDISNAGLDYSIVDSGAEDGTNAAMAKSCSKQIIGLFNLIQSFSPDLVLVLGDRGEMLAAATASLFSCVPVAHIHGGELSGTIDESIRHAISKMSHYHFVATQKSRERLIKMGEQSQNIFVVGAPGLDEIHNSEIPSESEVYALLGVPSGEPYFLCIFHPVVQDKATLTDQAHSLFKAIPRNVNVIVMRPNSDAGADKIGSVVDIYARENNNVRVFSHLSRKTFLGAMKYSRLMMGNSSSGIIEAASFQTPVLNVGDRQNLRERSNNVIDVAPDEQSIREGIERCLSIQLDKIENVYGDGMGAENISRLLCTMSIERNIVSKVNAY